MNSVTKAVVLAGLALALCFPAVGIADWDNTPAKWVQLPDLSPNGIDVNATAPMFLANDWQCTSPGAVTNIHIWGSWYHNAGDPNAVMFTLTIYDDIPTNESPTGYSMPGKAITNWFFQPGTFRVVPWAQGPQEGWYDPSQGSYEFPADDICWQYNFPIPPGEQFVQQGTRDVPKVYWLGVQAAPLEPGTFFGWKTTDLRACKEIS